MSKPAKNVQKQGKPTFYAISFFDDAVRIALTLLASSEILDNDGKVEIVMCHECAVSQGKLVDLKLKLGICRRRTMQ